MTSDRKVVPLRPTSVRPSARPSSPSNRPRASARPEATADFNVRVLNCLAHYIAVQHGDSTLEQIAAEAGLSAAELRAKATRWIPHAQFERLHTAARALFDSDDAFAEACAYRYRESFGPIRFLLGLVSPMRAYEKGCQVFNLVSRVSEMRFEQFGPNHARLGYSTRRPESRLLCLSRASALRVLPTLWGLPHARVEESACVSRGDPCCTYDVRVLASMRALLPALGLAIGAGAAALLGLTPLSSLIAYIALPLIGITIAYTYELRRTHRINLTMGDETNAILRELAQQDAEIRREILELHAREHEWTRLMEEQVSERAASLQEVVSRIRNMRASMESTIRGFSHDLRNPIFYLRAETEMFRDYLDADHPDVKVLLEDHDNAVGRVDRLLNELMDLATSETGLMRLTPEPLDVAPLGERVRRRLRALAHGKGIRISVFATREAPESIIVDHMVFDRVIDNLVTNAVKYTDRGSIAVEIAGVPGFLTIKISDSGRGIEADRIQQIFQPGGSHESERAPNSYGVGLSVVVQLLAQIGGRLEVMSKPNVGTTFWAHFPIESATTAIVTTVDRSSRADPKLDNVVTIRRVQPP